MLADVHITGRVAEADRTLISLAASQVAGIPAAALKAGHRG